MDIEKIASEIVNAAIKVHKALGPGLLESAYQQCLIYELKKRGLKVDSEVAMLVTYDGMKIDAGYRMDIVVDGLIVIENKTVEKIMPIHQAQLLTYLKLSGMNLGFLFNWNVTIMKDGIKRIVNNL